jgi:hypothetical protein
MVRNLYMGPGSKSVGRIASLLLEQYRTRLVLLEIAHFLSRDRELACQYSIIGNTADMGCRMMLQDRT